MTIYVAFTRYRDITSDLKIMLIGCWGNIQEWSLFNLGQTTTDLVEVRAQKNSRTNLEDNCVCGTGWRRRKGCLKLQFIFCKKKH